MTEKFYCVIEKFGLQTTTAMIIMDQATKNVSFSLKLLEQTYWSWIVFKNNITQQISQYCKASAIWW